ncbi:Ig-like domain-containing protein [Hymenobacter algoricola]|uniref:CBM6 domain-containing protein n=1 Tax=Hymenobacter algoricola TaxID=486267 RepID=A0ABP7MMJ7_9BACT
MLFFLVSFFGPRQGRAQAPNITYAAPLVITQGGTYTGNYRSLDSNVPVIKIETTQPVIIENCVLAGAGDLIQAKMGANYNLVVRNNKAYGLTPSLDNTRRGRFVEVNGGISVRIENNYVEHVSGIAIYLWNGNGTPSQTLTVTRNVVRNVDGRYRNGGGTFANFLGLIGVRNLANMEVAWNQVVNEPNNSKAEDNINFYNSGGTQASPAKLHDNYIQGAYPFPANSAVYSGAGITIDGDGNSPTLTSAFINGYNNQLVSTCAALNIAAGHDNHFYNNRSVTSGYLPDGTKLVANYAGMGLWNAYQQPSTVFYGNSFDNNLIGFVHWGGTTPYPNRQDTSPGNCSPCTNSTHMPNPVTLQNEQAEWTYWLNKLQQNNIVIGNGGSGPAPNAAPTVSLTAPANNLSVAANTALTLTATAADADGTVAKVEFFNGTTKLGEDLSAPYQLSYTAAATGTLSLTARATDNAGAATSSAATSVTVTGTTTVGTPPATPANATFFRALNVNGGAVTVDGKAWEAASGAANVQIAGTPFADQNATLNPTTDASRASMIRSSVYGPTTSAAIGGVSAGTYIVYLYVWEDNNAQDFTVTLEGQTVQTGHNSGAAGRWDRLGPFTANVSDGTINVSTAGGDANLSGVEIWKQNTVANPNTAPTVSLTAPTANASVPVSTVLTLTATAADADGTVAKVEFFNGTTKLGEDLSAPYQLSYTAAATGTLSLTARATDNTGAATSSAATSVTVTPATPPATTATFYRAIDIDGSPVQLDGNSWQGRNAQGYTVNGTGFANQGINLTPATTTARAQMIRSSVYTNALNFRMTAVPNGTYDVYVYIWEDNNPEIISLAVNGQAVQTNLNTGTAGSWKKLGPYAANVTGGAISITSTGGTINFSGVEIWRRSTSTTFSPAAPATPTTLKSTASLAPSSYPVAQQQALATAGLRAEVIQVALSGRPGASVLSSSLAAEKDAWRRSLTLTQQPISTGFDLRLASRPAMPRG